MYGLRRTIILSSIFAAIHALPTFAGTVTWTGAAGTSDWHTANNWIDNLSVARVPANLDDVVLANVGPSAEIAFSTGVLTINTINGSKPLTVSGGTLNIGDAATDISTIASLTLESTIGGAGELRVSSLFLWKNGTMSGTGKTVLNATATGTVGGGSQNYSLQRALVNNGSLSWTTRDIIFQNGSMTNSGTFIMSSSGAIRNSGGSITTTNNGIINKIGPATTEIHVVTFSNNGQININEGTLSLEQSFSFFSNGAGSVVNVASGAVLRLAMNAGYNTTSMLKGAGSIYFLDGGHSFPAGTFTPTGAVFFSATSGVTVNNTITPSSLGPISGNVTFNASQTFSDVTLSGTLGGSGDVSITHSLTWNGGTMAGFGGKTIIQPGATASFGTTPVTLNRRFDNAGVFTLSENTLFMGNATLNNFGTLNTINAGGFLLSGGGSTLNNSGVINVSGSVDTAIGVTFKNDGAVNVNSGSFFLMNASFTNNADINLEPGATLQVAENGTYGVNSALHGAGTLTFQSGTQNFPAGTLTPDGTLNFSGGTVTVSNPLFPASLGPIAGNVYFNSSQTFHNVTLQGTLGGSGVVTIDGQFNWNGQMTDGSQTILSAGSTTSVSGPLATVTQRQIHNYGTLEWTGGSINLVNGASIYNYGSLNAATPSTMNSNGANMIYNSGTLNINSAGTTTLHVPIENSGTVMLNAGTLALNVTPEETPFRQIGGAMWLNGGSIASNRILRLDGGVLSGSGDITSNIENFAADVDIGLSSSDSALISIAGDYVQDYNGSCTFDIGTRGTSACDQLIVSGNATLGGTVAFRTLAGFIPITGSEYILLSYGSRNEFFCRFVGMAIDPSTYFDPDYQADLFKVGITESVPILDCDLDGTANTCEADYENLPLFVYQLLSSTPDPELACLYDRTHDGLLNAQDIQPFVDEILAK